MYACISQSNNNNNNNLHQNQAEGETEILVAGDPERKHMAKCDKAGGITYHPNVIALLVSCDVMMLISTWTIHLIFALMSC